MEIINKYLNDYCNSVIQELDIKIRGLSIELDSPVLIYETSIDLIIKKLSEVKTLVLQRGFQNEMEEIRFFKYQKPLIVAKLIYYNTIYKIETKKPYGTKPIRKYLNKELKKLKRFFDNNRDFYKYYRSNNSFLRLIYFVGINRISNVDKQKELKSNIKYGLYGAENSSFIEIETINCDNSNTETPWEKEIEHLKEIQESLDEPSSFIRKRIDLINNFSGSETKGGTEEIFYNDLQGNPLKIRKNSAFFNDNNYFDNISQSDVYFTIACVLNAMRNSEEGLRQSNFVKNLLDPFVFNRFNDGIIQAAILRSAKFEELNYSYSRQNSENMLMLLKTFIKHHSEYQGEGYWSFYMQLLLENYVY